MAKAAGKATKNAGGAKAAAKLKASEAFRKSVGDDGKDDGTVELERQLAALGLCIKDMNGDGNCLFRALSDQLFGGPDRHGECRQAACDHMQAHPDLYAPFVDDGSLDSHIKRMRKPGVFGGNMELVAFARTHAVDIAVHQAGQPIWIVDGADAVDQPAAAQAARQPEPRPVLHVAYHSWEHYSSVRNQSGPHSGLPSIVMRSGGDGGGRESTAGQAAGPRKHAWDRDPSEPPTSMEIRVMGLTGVDDLPKVRTLFAKFRGDPGRVMDALYEDMYDSGQPDAHDPPDPPAAQTSVTPEAAGPPITPADDAAPTLDPTGSESACAPVATQDEPALAQTKAGPKAKAGAGPAKRVSARDRKEQARKTRKANALEKKRGKDGGSSAETASAAQEAARGASSAVDVALARGIELIRI
ncbi:hypothetical protein HK105_205687 [Polyrhizophydium stewartii]|uniref:OTU domain-containing protein n=1 Tax=Polyrhizophydium stewartii TaxID=2732419 RepID=A0ABR4N5D4_9FUNG|nr:hypothetical protein HK105_000177 [Polyrhizophydium stewartii]